ncbi:uncharacterized protein LOC131932735 [Physella acuta]|uniref:uncharacterized protein LOC131932735 n=1 Tax=Physella acuta TaxID=109671 RepID=UPI0027DCB6D8|nr:uncharacterized protein LOC131932735 [Physella acuta]
MESQRAASVGEGYIELEAVRRRTDDKIPFYKSEVMTIKHSYPFRFLVPEHATPGPCKWIYPMTYGGGLVGGDKITATIKVGAGCAAVVCSQESTKVYHCNMSHETVQNFNYSLGESALLCVLPDPTVCYRDANFCQKQVIHMTSTSSLVFLDWMLGGRQALEEFWCFKRFNNCTEIYVGEELIVRDSTDLEDTPIKTVAQAMENFQVYGTCIILGEGLSFLVESLINIYGRKRDLGEQINRDCVVSISETKYTVSGETIEGCYLRFLATDMKHASRVIHDISNPLQHLLGGDPFERKL